MRFPLWYLLGLWAALGGVLGCNGTPGPAGPPHPGTGARETAIRFFTALVHKDWGTAYQALDAGSRSRTGSAQFTRLAQSYHRNLGFEPAEVFVLACDEVGNKAIAHVALKGGPESSPRIFKDAVPLVRQGTDWAVVLPRHFGQRRGRK